MALSIDCNGGWLNYSYWNDLSSCCVMCMAWSKTMPDNLFWNMRQIWEKPICPPWLLFTSYCHMLNPVFITCANPFQKYNFFLPLNCRKNPKANCLHVYSFGNIHYCFWHPSWIQFLVCIFSQNFIQDFEMSKIWNQIRYVNCLSRWIFNWILWTYQARIIQRTQRAWEKF